MMLVTEITTCRSCGSERLETVLNLGELMISDFILPGEPEESAPLELVCCLDCSLVQLRHTVDRDRLYRDNYYYKSSTNESMVSALKDVVEDAMRRVELKDGDSVLDLGCNDGALLAGYPDYVFCQGFEPNLHLQIEAAAKLSTQRKHAIIYPDYFPPREWRLFDQFKIVTSIACLYNVATLNAYVAQIERILAPDGIWVIQMAYLPETLRTLNIGDFVHEHLTFWTVTALDHLLADYDLGIADVSFNDVNGGSFRVIVKHGQSTYHASDRVTSTNMRTFVELVKDLKDRTVAFLETCRENGKLTLGLGASTKNNTVLDWYGIGPELLPYIADRNPEKWGKITTGSHIPIISEQQARAMNPDYFFVGPFHFLKSLCQREQAFLERGGKFIVPFPELEIVGLKEADRLGAIHAAV